MTLTDVELERMIVAPLIGGPDPTFDSLIEVVTVADFTDRLCADLFSAACALHAAGTARTWLTVADAASVDRERVRRFEIEQTVFSSPVTLRPHALRLAEIGARRRFLLAMSEMVRVGHDDGLPLEQLYAMSRDALEASEAPQPVVPAPSGIELVEAGYEYDWLVPGLVERRDRVIVTGPEGRGKSTLLRQIAVQLAAGLHPFTRVGVVRCRVLIVDLENSRPQLGRSLKRLFAIAGDDCAEHLWVQERGQGMDLRARSDAQWLDGLLGRHSPDVLVIGPLYKAFRTRGRESKNDETAAEEAASVLDRLRVKHDCALLIEAHSPHGDSGDRAGWRPYGASLWLRWPERGLGMKPLPGNGEVELVQWRGAREREARWPRFLAPGHRWPWEAVEAKEDVA